jgi:hypothetical protein
MGYTTEFSGQVAIEPPLSSEEIEFLTKFAKTRRMDRKNGPYFVDGTGFHGQGKDADIIDRNVPPEGQPGLWCKWVPTEDGKFIEWDGGDYFYASEQWMRYLVEHFLKPGHIADLPFLGEHTLNGSILAQGEDMRDRWKLHVVNNEVSSERLENDAHRD